MHSNLMTPNTQISHAPLTHGPLPLLLCPPPSLMLDDLLSDADPFRGGILDMEMDGDDGEPLTPPTGPHSPYRRGGRGAQEGYRCWDARQQQLLGLDGSEPDVVQDAVTLAWLRRETLRMVVVLVPDVEDVDGSMTPGGGKGVGSGPCGSGAGLSAGAGAGAGEGSGWGGRPVMSREHVKCATSVLKAAQQHGTIMAGTVSDVVEVLQHVVGRTPPCDQKLPTPNQ